VLPGCPQRGSVQPTLCGCSKARELTLYQTRLTCGSRLAVGYRAYSCVQLVSLTRVSVVQGPCPPANRRRSPALLLRVDVLRWRFVSNRQLGACRRLIVAQQIHQKEFARAASNNSVTLDPVGGSGGCCCVILIVIRLACASAVHAAGGGRLFLSPGHLSQMQLPLQSHRLSRPPHK
jgi:hypothetical protein